MWERVDLIEGDVTTLMPGLDCVLYADTHAPGHQCVYVQTANGAAAIIGNIAAPWFR